MTAALAHRNRLLGKGTWTDEGGTFNADPPLANLGTGQTPGPRAEFTGTTAEFSFAALDAADAAENFNAQVLALIGHTLPDGALIEWQRSDGSLIAAQTWRRYSNRPANSYIVLPAAETLNTIHCTISNVASGTYGIAAAFAGERWAFCQKRGWETANKDASTIARTGGTDWPYAGARRRGLPVRGTLQTYTEAYGVPDTGTTVAVPGTWDTDNSTSESAGVYTFTGVSAGVLLAKTSLFTADTWYRVKVKLTQGASNAGVVTADIGSDGDQALQEGTTTLVAKATDATFSLDAQSTFTGDIEILSIEALATGLTGDDIQTRLDQIGTTNHIIWMPRTGTQQDIAATAVYGLIENAGKIPHEGGAWHTVEFDVLESR